VIEPPFHKFKLPGLRGENIVTGFFLTPPGPSRTQDQTHDWVTGNPPWRKISLENPQEEFVSAAEGIKEHSESPADYHGMRPIAVARLQSPGPVATP
jgi:hypothetical protein